MHRNGFRVHASNDELLRFALAVAEGTLDRPESERWLTARTTRDSWTRARLHRWLASLEIHERHAVDESLRRGDAHARGSWMAVRKALDDFAHTIGC